MCNNANCKADGVIFTTKLRSFIYLKMQLCLERSFYVSVSTVGSMTHTVNCNQISPVFIVKAWGQSFCHVGVYIFCFLVGYLRIDV